MISTHTDIAMQFHQLAMELADLGKMYKIKGELDLYKEHLRMAFILDKEAALSIQEYEGTDLQRVAYPRSAAWLAFENGNYKEALELAALGMNNAELAPDIEIVRLNELIQLTHHQLKKTSSKEKKRLRILGTFSSADIETYQIKVKDNQNHQYIYIVVPAEQIKGIARLYLGDIVEVKAQKNEEGTMILEDIRRAA